MNIIEVTNLRKSYGKHMALDGIDLSIQEVRSMVLLDLMVQGNRRP